MQVDAQAKKLLDEVTAKMVEWEGKLAALGEGKEGKRLRGTQIVSNSSKSNTSSGRARSGQRGQKAKSRAISALDSVLPLPSSLFSFLSFPRTRIVTTVETS